MLLQFTVENYLSFDQTQTFSMRAGGDKDHADHVISHGKLNSVRATAIYGANAAGKSNLILAMDFARRLIARDGATMQGLRQFRLADETNKRASGFHWIFLFEGKQWSYGFDITPRRVVEEYLVAQNQNGVKEDQWFMRKTDEEGISHVEWSDKFLKSLPKEEAQLLELSGKRTPADELLLWRFIDNQIEVIAPVEEWFNSVLTIIPAESKYEPLLPLAHNSAEFLEFLSEFLKFADVGIQCLVTARRELKVDSLFGSEAPTEIDNMLRQHLENLEIGEVSVAMRDYVPVAIEKGEDGKLWMLNLMARHTRDDGSTDDFRLEWESSGTQRLIHLLAALFQLKSQTAVVVIDEIERRFHVKLTRRFIEMALRGALPGNQIIFATHDTHLLDSSLLRRDEIVFALKQNKRTILERLSDYQIRSDRDYEKAYDIARVGSGGPHLAYQMFDLMEGNPNPQDELNAEVNALAAT